MKSSKSVIVKRQQQLLAYLKTHDKVKIEELSELLGVSQITVRRDLKEFQSKGLIDKFHGGVILNRENDADTFVSSNTLVTPQKLGIARHAASLVEDGDTIFINSSSTCLLMLKFIKDRRIIVITNNARAVTVPRNHNIDLILTGGEVYEHKDSLVGEMAVQALSRVVPTKVFIGVSGISAATGLTSSVLQETAINELMMKRGEGNCYVLADNTKIGRKHNFLSGTINMVNYLITDNEADSNELENIGALGVKIVKVDPASFGSELQ